MCLTILYKDNIVCVIQLKKILSRMNKTYFSKIHNLLKSCDIEVKQIVSE